MQKNSVQLKPGKEKAILNHHHWIFSGAVSRLPKFSDGEILPVLSSSGVMLGSAYFNRKAGIVGRMVTFDSESPLDAIRKSLEAAANYRLSLFNSGDTNAYRLINGEGDCLPGLVVDRYDDVFVVQISTLGMEKLKPLIVEWLKGKFSPKTIYEKSKISSRKEEGLEGVEGHLYGEEVQEVEIIENGLKFLVDVVGGQKTGFFCDHREMRKLIGNLSCGKRVLNCFAYSGGFTVYALAGGAANVVSVDISGEAMEQAMKNVSLNGFQAVPNSFRAADVFEFLRKEPLDYDIVILDPPAFAKRQKDVVAACRGYKDINRIAMQKMPPGSWLLTCSCSYHVDEELFQKVVFQAAVEAGRMVRIAGKHIMAPDHPVNICHPESDYLKSLLLYIQ